MLYYSEELGKKFETEEECLAAEKEYLESVEKAREEKELLKAEKKARADEIAEAYSTYKAAEKHYYELRNSFIKDYGYWHSSTYSTTNLSDVDVKNWLDEIFNTNNWF